MDVYHKKIPAEKSWLTVMLYISFFPAVTSGPITKARDLVGQFKAVKQINRDNLTVGLQIFVLGCLEFCPVGRIAWLASLRASYL
ncbi:hypothetical protein [Selenomonas ruminantium]|uniref:hypothetical protein n=1 Tax=Selenomonas ruminantium TaxID=971 RepID=UPI0013155383|nr:hypothetical protein [Selenomonas ruminantium]